MKKLTLFKSFLLEVNNNSCFTKKEYKYIGTGNPLSKILIIGKEAAISVGNEQYHREITNNIDFWLNINHFNQRELKERNNEYNPLYPYKGQSLKKDNKKGNGGTSTTWMNYQKLYNYIFDTPTNNEINFHEGTFLTEVNSTPSKKTSDAETQSIKSRKKYFFNSSYIRSFPITIISGVGYFKITEKINEIEQIFSVNFNHKKYANNNSKQPYWIHWNEEKTKILINTYQLSFNVSNKLLEEIAIEIRNSNLLND